MDRSSPSRSTWLALLALAGATSSVAAQRAAPRQRYELIVLPGGTSTRVEAVSRTGMVAGVHSPGAMLWTRASGPVTLPPLVGWSFSWAQDVDRNGVAVGRSTTGSMHVATLWPLSGIPQEIPVPGATSSDAGAINSAGLVVGSSDAGSWVWDALNGARLLAPLGLPSDCYLRDLSESGQLVGGQPYSQAWRFDLATSTLLYLGTLGGMYSEASGVNAAGHVVGRSMTSFGAFTYTPFLWTPEEGMRFLGTLEPPWMFLFEGGASAVNDHDEIVGSMQVQGGHSHAFLWDRTHGMRDLNALVPARGPYELESAYAIGNTGWIIGRALDTSIGDAMRAFVLRPH